MIGGKDAKSSNDVAVKKKLVVLSELIKSSGAFVLDSVGFTKDDAVSVAERILSDGKMIDMEIFFCSPDYYTGIVIVATGTSVRHIAGVLNKLLVACKNELAVVPILDSRAQDWIVVDIGCVVIHLMTAPKREHYNIEQRLLDLGAEKESFNFTI